MFSPTDSVWRKRDEDLALERPHPLTMLARTKPKSEPVLFKAQVFCKAKASQTDAVNDSSALVVWAE